MWPEGRIQPQVPVGVLVAQPEVEEGELVVEVAPPRVFPAPHHLLLSPRRCLAEEAVSHRTKRP